MDYKFVKMIDLDLQLFSIVKDLLLIIKLLHVNLIMQATLNLQFRRCSHYKPNCEGGFKTYSGGVAKVKTIVTHFHRSTAASEQLGDRCVLKS